MHPSVLTAASFLETLASYSFPTALSLSLSLSPSLHDNVGTELPPFTTQYTEHVQKISKNKTQDRIAKKMSHGKMAYESIHNINSPFIYPSRHAKYWFI